MQILEQAEAADQVIGGYKFSRLYDIPRVENRLGEIGNTLGLKYMNGSGSVHLVAVLGGALDTMATLRRSMQSAYPELEITSDFTQIATHAQNRSSGVIREISGMTTDVNGRDVLLVEDVLRTGRTVNWIGQTCMRNGANSVDLVSLVQKGTDLPMLQVPVSDITVGFTVDPSIQVAGYGVGIGEVGRGLPGIYQKID